MICHKCKTKNWIIRASWKTVDDVRCHVTISIFYSTIGIHYSVKKHEHGEIDVKLTTTNWPYPYNFRNYDFIYAVMNSWFNSFLISFHLYTKSWYEGQALAYRINWERYTQYGGTSGMLFHISGQIVMRKFKTYRLS